MMRYLSIVALFVSFATQGQSLREINYSYRYNPVEPISFALKPERTSTGWKVFYSLQLRDTALRANQFVLQWDIRKDLGAKEGVALQKEHITKTIDALIIDGYVTVETSVEVQVLVVKVLNNTLKRAWVFWKGLEPEYPVDGTVVVEGKPIMSNYLKAKQSTILQAQDSSLYISYYNDNFPAAAPGFSEGMARVPRAMKTDSIFMLPTQTEIRFAIPGLYLAQKDTALTQGFAFRVVEDYPRLEKVESLADPLIYICTKQEYDRVKLAKGDKKAYDKVILSITGEVGRAKTFMRSYFKRVELANQLFTSYKEGWKTDRGMIYIIFGLPDQVYAFSDREVWTYKKQFDITFNFTKSSTLFDPDNYVLIRDKKYTTTWYEVIDLWRNARF